MKRWTLTAGLATLTLAAALVAPKLLPVFQTTAVAPGASNTSGYVVDTVDTQPAAVTTTDTSRSIDVVIAIDTSSSMDDLIDSVRARLWDIVNTIDERDPNAELRVGLMAFGSPSYGAKSGYVKTIQPLTSDLDDLYTAAWALQTHGGDEYVGATIQAATAGMDWAPSDNADNRRLLFIAGNESATQGRVQATTVAATAKAHGIRVSTLYAGAERRGRAESWEAVALAGGGTYLAVDAESSAVAVSTPFDQELVDLNQEVNGTYIQYGSRGKQKMDAMRSNDAKASSYGVGSLASRIASKGGGKFKTKSWDLVDAGEGAAAAVDKATLPSAYQNLSDEELNKAVEEQRTKRASAKRKIQDVQKKRQAYLQEQKQQADSNGLDDALSEALTTLL